MYLERESITGKVGLVPTMGSLHKGHERLLDVGRELSDTLVATIFVNPTQFARNDDYDNYPRSLESDLKVAEAHGVDLLFVPPRHEMYGENDTTSVHPGAIANVSEGIERPGHFIGVATVVTKLFLLIRPQLAVFGEKDAQQIRVVQQLSSNLLMGIDIVTVPTVRDSAGVAFASRNRYLSPPQRAAATVLWDGMQAGLRAWRAGERNSEALAAIVRLQLVSEPLICIDYVQLVSPDDFCEVQQAENGTRLCIAVIIGDIRLIDNIELR